MQKVSAAGTMQRGLDQVCLHFAEFTSLLIHFSLSKIRKAEFFIFGWQSPAELIKSEVRRIPSDFIDHVSCVFYAGDFLSMLFGTWEKNHNIVVFSPSFSMHGK